MQDNGGNIVNMVADMWMGWPNYAHSGASRAGRMNLTESAAAEWAPSGVRVNAVAPGGVASSGFDTYTREAQEIILEFPKAVPLQRYGNVAEVSSAITYLLSPAAPVSGWTAARPRRVPAGSNWRNMTDRKPMRAFTWTSRRGC
jgi:citronellol/citronellal dehydrogenase